MRFELEFFLFTVATPAIATAVIASFLRQFLPQAWMSAAVGLAAAVGCVLGYVLLPEWAPHMPQRHWQWILYLTPAAAIVGTVLTVGKAPRGRQIALLIALIVLGALVSWRIVPGWDDLQPPRSALIPLLTFYFAGLMLGLMKLPARLRGRTFCVLLLFTAASLVVLVGVEASVKLGHTAAVFAAALFGCYLWSLRIRESAVAEASIGLIPVFVIASVGFAFAGAIEPTQRAWILLLLPAAPLMLWLFVAGPLSRLTGRVDVVLQVLAVALIPLAIGGWLLLQSPPEDDWSANTSPTRQRGTLRIGVHFEGCLSIVTLAGASGWYWACSGLPVRMS